ncbi:MAG: 3-phosphoshikimate 1-carboxyvinyltransferase [Planctomycetota bacterium]|nr:3-phosphoshikimate 1-carboxyvinyltransferase [Planctomycetota bacterium]
MSDPTDRLEIQPFKSPLLRAKVRVPGSKSLTNRALIIAALAEGKTQLTGALDSQDTQVLIRALNAVGIPTVHDPIAYTIDVVGQAGSIPAASANLDLANSGTSLRFLTAMLALGHGKYTLDGSARMRQRPIADLLAALNRVGAIARSEANTGCPPVLLDADGLQGGFVGVRGDVSSQFLSGLLMALPYAANPSEIEVDGNLVSVPYVTMTIEVMRAFGVKVDNRKNKRFIIKPGQYFGRDYAIEPDASAASYFFALAAITGGTVTVEGLGNRSLQGDVDFVHVLAHMGCLVESSVDKITVTGGQLKGLDIDMNAISDTVMTLAVVALFAQGATRIRNVAHIRHKETDRIAAIANELRKFGAEVIEHYDGLTIIPPLEGQFKPAEVATYDDHRIAMSFALAGLKVPGTVILDPGCVGKTYPGYWNDLNQALGR